MPSSRVEHAAQMTARQRMHTPTPGRSGWYLQKATGQPSHRQGARASGPVPSARAVEYLEAVQALAELGLQPREAVPARAPGHQVHLVVALLLDAPHQERPPLAPDALVHDHFDRFGVAHGRQVPGGVYVELRRPHVALAPAGATD